MFKFVYKSMYLKPLSFLGGFFNQEHAPADTPDKVDEHQLSENISFDDVDGIATLLGDRYRGIGVLVGLLGLVVVLCALLPIAFPEDFHGHFMCYVEIVLMLFMAGLVVYAGWSGLHGKWIDTRIQAELKRYSGLRTLILTLEKGIDNPELQHRVAESLESILSGNEGQIAYNENKAREYRSIEELSGYLGWLGFSIAFVGVCMHLFLHEAHWLILFTAFSPACVAAIHGINAFLRLSDLKEGHEKTAFKLNVAINQLEMTKGLINNTRLIELAREIYQVLTDRDLEWQSTVDKSELKVG